MNIRKNDLGLMTYFKIIPVKIEIIILQKH